MKFFNVKSEAEAYMIIDQLAKAYKIDNETIKTIDACHRTLAQDIVSKADVPAFNRSTVDGYAVLTGDTHGATSAIPSLLETKGEIEMGQVVTEAVGSLETMYVPTGGMLPDNADGVVMIEDAEVLDETTIAIYRAITAGDNVIHRGDDIQIGTVALEKGRTITAIDIGVLSALGIDEVQVIAPMKVTILSTGDEIVAIDQQASLGQIYDVNGNVLDWMCRDLGMEIVHRDIVKDDYDALYSAVLEGTKTSDLILLSGGSSVGTRDYTYDVINNLEDSEMFLQGVAVKPGKPTILGRGNGKIIFGLPGHPVSSIMIFKLFVESFVRQVTGQEKENRPFEGVLTESVHGAPGRAMYHMVNLKQQEDHLDVIPNYGRSGMISLLSTSVGTIRIDANAEGIEAGTVVKGSYL